ncbi:MAG: TonB-dependent receptor, partial [Alphaproteobacteria bacterium]|nr:TonB-dependent receptor [Alphaproteobacteria bacterium]
ELWLSLGYLDKALVAAERAASLAPNLGRTNTILGFAALAQIKTSEAKAAFERAIVLESENPLPRLGLGLAKIRESALRDGRREIEIAASLDPNNSLVRSYLGKAYFEERRSLLAVDQFTLAKELDPADPTPWFYDAVRKQTENRPVEALKDLQKSIELNDNRAVYRSRLLLDEDLAVRGTSLARAYDDLGFEQLALVEGTKSLSLDPANHSAHRFLSDSYAARPRHEIARASELLQAQLLQPININPVQPRLVETDLNILAGAGPAEAAFNEFTPLFQRDGHQLVVSGVGGNNGTWGDEAVLTGITGRFSYSVGQFHYESDGFRVNNDVQHDLYNIFAQAALTPQLDVQFEYRRRDTDEGDLRLNFNPDDFSIFNRRELEQDTARLGLHYDPSPRSDFLVSLIYTDRTEELDELDAGVALDADSQTKGYDAQVQYLYRGDRFNITAGLGNSDLDTDERQVLDLSGTFGGVCPPFFPTCDNVVIVTTDPTEQHNAYLYGNVAWPTDMIWTFGVSYDSFEQDPVEVDRFNPKVGLQWNFTKNARLRLAYMETVKRSLIVNQTLEPTQVAGFNQFFDDINGTIAERYGIGLDATLTKNLYGGLELSRRDLELPRVLLSTTPPSVLTEDQDEVLYRAYLYWTPDPEWAVRAEFQYEKFEREEPPGLPSPLEFPTKVNTMTVPLGVRYFRTTGLGAGFFAELVATYVHQEVDVPTSTFGRDRDDFVLVDAAIGYRLPKRRGILSLEVRNLFDEEFLFQDANIQLAEPSNPRFIPDRTIMGRITLSF